MVLTCRIVPYQELIIKVFFVIKFFFCIFTKKSKVMNYNLFLDDFRFPRNAQEYTHRSIYSDKEWVIVRNYNEFVNYIINHSIPDVISFDHDLGYEHYNNYSNGDIINYDKFNEKTGYDCAKWLIDYIVENKLTPPKEILIHSMNPIGSENIRKLFINFYKFYYNI